MGILIVEDDDSIRESLRRILEAEGHEIFCAANGREALTILRHGVRPCVILLDLTMPIMSGWDVLDAVAEDEALQGIPVVVMSAHALDHGERMRVSQASSTFLRKPVNLEQLLTIVERHGCVASPAVR